MLKKLQRGLCFLLCIVMAFSCAVVPAGAIVISSAISALVAEVGPAVTGWVVGKAVDESLQALSDWIESKTTDTDGLIAHIGALKTAQKTLVSDDTLRELAYEWNTTCSAAVGFTVDVVDHTLDTGEVYRVIAVRRGYVATTAATQYCLADGVSRILYCDATTELSGRWAPEDQTSGRHLLEYNALFNLSQEVGGMLRLKDNFYEIYKRDGTLYCNVAGRRFSCIYEPDKTAIDQDRPTTGGTVIEGDTITNIENNDNSVTNNDYSQEIDIENMTQVLPGGTQNVIDNLIYDDNTKTYYVDSHDVTNNITQNYSYQYHINYTSITYIGQSEEYNKRYELYYQLPDGRDSADLTREELEQLNVDIDVIPYVRSTDNADVRSLYHFDADTRDSSYWNYITAFEWITGASLTYLESGAFDGALYLDENQHAFRLIMPVASDTAGDWTLQWRYYQSHTAAPVNDSSVYVGDKPVMTMDGQYFYTPAGDQIAVIPTGSWNEVCIIRSGGRLYYYVNGVYYTSADDDNSRLNDIRFIFGSEQQTNKQIDELRFSRGALYTPGENYTPTSVPHDSNLALILPTGKDVLVDEVGVFMPGQNNLLTPYGRDDWRSIDVNSLERDYSPYYPLTDYMNSDSTLVHTSGYPVIWDRDHISFNRYPQIGLSLNFHGTAFSCTSPESSCYSQPHNSISLPLFFDRDSVGSHYVSSTLIGDWKADTVFTCSVVLDDLSYSSVTFRIVSCKYSGVAWSSAHGHYCSSDSLYLEILNVVQNSEIQFSFEELGLVHHGSYEDENGEIDYFYDRIYPATALCFNSVDGAAVVRYVELVEGDTHQFEVDYETAVYDEGQLTHSPTLAVRTDIPVTDYQIGGVRPSVPEKGQVWALVESGYITSLQVYTGSVWINCDGRIWTGQRWIPASSYNVITLQDMYDIVDATQDYEYIYTESGFWGWLQKAWKDMIARFDRIIELIEKGGEDTPEECQHVYDLDVDRMETCTESGYYLYTCSNCGQTFTEYIAPLGHKWPVSPDDFVIWQQPQDVTAPFDDMVSFSVAVIGKGLCYQWQTRTSPTGSWLDLDYGGALTSVLSLNFYSYRDGYQYRCVITDINDNTLISDIATLKNGAASAAPGDPVVYCSQCGCKGDIRDGAIVCSDVILEAEIFDALGDFIAEGIDWILEKATDLVNSLNGITEIFNRFVDRIRGLLGFFPAFLAAVFAYFPEDLASVIWFGVIVFVVRAVWKKYNKS